MQVDGRIGQGCFQGFFLHPFYQRSKHVKVGSTSKGVLENSRTHRNTHLSSAAYNKAIYKAILNQNSTSTLVIPGTVESCDEWIERCDEWIEGFKSVRQSARHV